MTPEEHFKTLELDPDTGVYPRDWFAFGTVFQPKPIAYNEGTIIHGMRTLTAMDVASRFMLGFELIEKKPGIVYASRLIPFINRMFSEFSKPQKGVVVSHSCWLSSSQLAADPDTRGQSHCLQEAGVRFEAMPEREKEKLRDWANEAGIDLLFSGDEIY